MSVRLITPAADRRLLDEGKRTRSMSWIMAIMLFLTVLAAALGLATFRGAGLLDRQLAGRLTVQIVEADGAMRDAETARALEAIPDWLHELGMRVALDLLAIGPRLAGRRCVDGREVTELEPAA